MEAVSKILVLGSGAIKIAEAAEFDYSGNQALKALKEEALNVVLVNPNVATIQTSYKFADKVYLIPLKPEYVAKVIEIERPDGILVGFGGQTALSLGVRLHDDGVLSKYSVKVLGTPIEGIRAALSRSLFRRVMEEHGIPVPPSAAVGSFEEALYAAEDVGYPVMVRVSFNLGGAGSFVAWSRSQLIDGLRAAFAQSEVGEVLVEKYLHHWKEIEFEVVRDRDDNVAAIACLENLDPMGVHTGESVVVAPCQTLTDYEYQLSRDLSISVERAIMLIGEGNVQVALNPLDSSKAYVIETNPRMSRSSALASKATGYPLAYVAAKLALGYKLHEIKNKVTGITSANFEPSLDYVVVKVPRWDLDKFEYVERRIGTEMKSVGEVMAVGRSFVEALQKAIRMLDVGEPGLVGGPLYEDESLTLDRVVAKLANREPYWPLYVAKAFKMGLDVDTAHRFTGVDKHFLEQIKNVVEFYERLKRLKTEELSEDEVVDAIAEAKRLGFSDLQIARALGLDEDYVRELRLKYGIKPVVKQIDTLAAEWPATTNYLYLTYNGYESDVISGGSKPKVLVLGAGGFRIGVSVEFDWSIVTFSDEARRLGYEVIVLNFNPETVSTDWDVNEKLYFDEITVESVLEVYDHEKPIGVVVFLGGQTSNNIALDLERRGVKLLGTGGPSIDVAENRALFSKLLDELGIKQPPWADASNLEETIRFAETVGYPVLVRPSYALSGTSMKIAYSREEIVEYVSKAAKVSSRHPVVVSKFIEDAIEFDVDAVSGGGAVVGTVVEHVEPAGVHSGDSTMVIPYRLMDYATARRACSIAKAIAEALNIVGPFNLQMLLKDGEVYVIELNLRGSRSMPFVSKTTGYNLMKASAEAVLRGRLSDGVERGKFNLLKPRWYGVKTPQFSWTRLRGSYPYLGPEMRSVGEVAALGVSYERALLLSWLSASGNKPPRGGEFALVYDPTGGHSRDLKEAARNLSTKSIRVLTIEGMEIDGFESISVKRALELIARGLVGLLMTTGYNPARDYKVRRLAADMAMPLVLNHRLALELSRGIARYGEILEDDVRDISSYWSLGLVVVQFD